MTATLYGQTVKANTLTGLKRKATTVANQYYNAVDEMFVTVGSHVFKYIRINRKAPDNTIRRGQWQ